ncbi:uncharacterized protein L3040_007952 [Drepanopeziza brunnea f. sp. 'multigermtubi']|uniref:uncharacterized protein n=1 Tax=Drepanopeziza brunnea f. sp. 'multigermtubi' TaxID=698441 RepID=UPI00239C48B7|nr:hypothetical protein L3040_007952 [Drepanopeziza brunnea f. sp. 'multigermtubi']
MDLVVQILATLFLKEPYPPKILVLKVKNLIAETGNKALHTNWQDPNHSLSHILRKNMVRPFVMLATQPTIQIMAFYRGYIYGLMYLVYVVYDSVATNEYHADDNNLIFQLSLGFRNVYGMSIDVSLNYLYLAVGFVIGPQICAPAIIG